MARFEPFVSNGTFMVKCNYCSQISCIRKGKRMSKQRLKCKNCGKYQKETYTYHLYRECDNKQIRLLNAEGVGIRSMARILGYSPGTIIRKILVLKKNITKPIRSEFNQVYELDEICTYIQKNNPSYYYWIAYAINRRTNDVIDIAFGARTSENLGKITSALKSLHPLKIITDKLNTYPKIIVPVLHDTRRYANNKIERSHLTFRTHIKRLLRKTICYSKSEKMLEACVLLYLDYHDWNIKMS